MTHESERFKEIKVLGQGQFGQTLLVQDRADDNRLVAIKVPIDKNTEQTLIHEVINNAILYTSLKEIEHPNIVKYLGFDKYKDLYVMIMEYVEGKDLSSVMGHFRDRPPLDVSLALRIAVNVCSGLVAAHNARLFHSDLKPANILVRDKDGVAKLCDFGVSRILRSTSAAEFAGTWLYSAPELLEGKASFQADIWSLSAVLYEMVTGVVPFAWTGNFNTFKAKIDGEAPPPPKRLNPKVDDRLNAVILRGLERDTNKRFKRAQEMLTALEACTAPASEAPRLTDDPSPKTSARRVVGALSALAFLGAAVVYVRQPPVIERMTCDPCVLEAGKTTTLSWNTKGASKVMLERDFSPRLVTTAVDKSGVFQDTPKQRTTYALIATSPFGATARSGKITVVPVDISFSSTGGYIPMLSWKVSEPTAKVSLSSRGLSLPATLIADNLPAQGLRICEQNKFYVLTATIDGVKFEKSVYVIGRSLFSALQYDGLPGHLHVVGNLLFFASKSSTPPEPGSRNYETSFTIYSSTTLAGPWIFWQLKLKNEGSQPTHKIPVVAVWYKKKPLLDTYEEVFRARAVELDSPELGQANTYKSGWNGGLQGWLTNSSLLGLGLRLQDNFRVDLFAGPTKIASGEFSVRSDPFTRRSFPAKRP